MEFLSCLSILSGLLRGNWSVTTHSQGEKEDHVQHVGDSQVISYYHCSCNKNQQKTTTQLIKTTNSPDPSGIRRITAELLMQRIIQNR